MALMWWSTPPPSTSAATPTWSVVPWWSTTRRPREGRLPCRTPPAQCPPVRLLLDIRGLKTLDLRVKRHSANALKVAEWLESQPSDVIERVWYPGLESHPGHEIAARQMHGGFGGIVSVQLAAGAEAAKHFVDHTQIFTLAESLGGVESLIEVPAAMTHASVAGTTLQVPANLVRISVGIENADDLIADLKQALDRI